MKLKTSLHIIFFIQHLVSTGEQRIHKQLETAGKN